MSNRLKFGILIAMGLICLVAMAAYAADGDFSGKWKGEAKASPLAARGTRGAPAGAPEGNAAPSAPEAPSPTTDVSSGGGRGGGRGGRGGGGGFPAAGSGGGNSSKVSLNLKQSKDNKLSGNITFGDANADDVKDGKVEDGKISFSAGRAPQPIYAYTGEMKGDELILTRIAPAGGRGSRTTEYVLTKK